MNIRIRRPRSCLGYLGWLVTILFIFVLLYNGYEQVRVSLARIQAEGLARELGYTPDSFLSEKRNQSNANIITGSYLCYTEFFFVTSLDMPEFENRLQNARRRVSRTDPFPGNTTDIYFHLPLMVVGADGNEVTDSNKFPPIRIFSWSLSDELLTGRGYADLYQIEPAFPTLMYAERPINGNIAVIRRNAGRFPLWVFWC